MWKRQGDGGGVRGAGGGNSDGREGRRDGRKIDDGEYLKRKLLIYWRIGIKKNCERKRGNFDLFKSWRLKKYPLPCRALTLRNY